MGNKRPKTVPYRRRREKKTNYQKRLRLLLANKPRLIVRFTNQRVIAQAAEFSGKGDKIIAAVDSFALKKLGWAYSCKNFPAAYLTGLMLGKKALGKGCQEAILDTGFHNCLKKGKIYAFLRGALDAGLKVPYRDEEIFPEPERIEGKHLKSGSLGEEAAAQFKKIKQQLSEKSFEKLPEKSLKKKANTEMPEKKAEKS